MAVQPLSPATDRRLGGPLPHQLSNQTRAHLSAIKSLMTGSCAPVISCGISGRFQPLSPSERQVAHALLTRSPLSPSFRLRRDFHKNSVRLACVRHAASVRPEPGSNSLENGIVSGRFFIGHTTIIFLSFALSLTQEITLTYNVRGRFIIAHILKIVQGVCSCFSLFNFQGTLALQPI